MNNKKILYIVHAAMIAAVYTAATYLSAALGIAYGPIQLRISEALTVLPVFTPAAIPGLAIGCMLGNISSPFGIWDVILGSLATLIAAFFTRKLRAVSFKGIPLLSILMPVIFNGLIVGAEITFFLSDSASFAGFLIAAGEVALGEAAVCFTGGTAVFLAVRRTDIFGKVSFL